MKTILKIILWVIAGYFILQLVSCGLVLLFTSFSTFVSSPTPAQPASTTPTYSPIPTNTPFNVSALQATPTIKNPSKAVMKDGTVMYQDEEPPCVGGTGQKVQLVNNKEAQVPTLQQLYAFLKQDKTDQKAYIRDFRVCVDFAEQIHNNAEKKRIRSAFVIIKFFNNPIGHALNAFETTDKGLVFVDCTGEEPVLLTPPVDLNTGKEINKIMHPDSYDKIAFLNIGNQYGLISAAAIQYPRTRWSFSTEYESYISYQNLVTENETQTLYFIKKVEKFKSSLDSLEKKY